MWKLCVVDDESNRTEVVLGRSEYTVGRAEENAIRLTERNISRKHARIFKDEGEQWQIEDRGSYTGCFVNGARIAGKHLLHHGDTITLGDYRIELTDEDQVQATDTAGPGEQEYLPDRFEVLYGPDVGAVYPLTESRLLVGRGEECQIALDDVSVSRVHIEIVRTEHGLMVLDQNSSNGLRINGVDLPSAMLRSGDVIELGDVKLKFIPEGARSEDVAPAISVGPPSQSGSRAFGSKKAWLIYGPVAVAGIFAIIWLTRSEPEAPVASPEVVQPRPKSQSPQEKVLSDAQQLMEQGQIVAAHRRLKDLPATDALRESRVVRQIEDKWADEMFEAAERSPDVAEKRQLLDAIAGAPEVDTARRKRASEMVRLLVAGGAVDIADLPASGSRVASPKPEGGRHAEPRATRTDPAAASGTSGAAAPARREEVPAERPAAGTTKPHREASGGQPELIRQTPF